jgi:hypothetical protein
VLQAKLIDVRSKEERAGIKVLTLVTYMVTRSGEISPIGRLFSLGSFMKMTEVVRIFCSSFLHGKCVVLILTKKCFGLHLGLYFGRYFQILNWSPW